MGKKKKKLIPKNKDIEDIIFKDDNESIKNMEDVVETLEEQQEEKTIKTEREQFTEEIRANIDKKAESHAKIKDSQRAEHKRQVELLKAIEKTRQEEENTL